jgi:hypothetical protein
LGLSGGSECAGAGKAEGEESAESRHGHRAVKNATRVCWTSGIDVLCAAWSDSATSHQLRSGDASGRIIQFETASTSEVAGGRNAAAASQRRPGQFDTCGHAPEPISKPPPLRAYHLPERWDLFA